MKFCFCFCQGTPPGQDPTMWEGICHTPSRLPVCTCAARQTLTEVMTSLGTCSLGFRTCLWPWWGLGWEKAASHTFTYLPLPRLPTGKDSRLQGEGSKYLEGHHHYPVKLELMSPHGLCSVDRPSRRLPPTHVHNVKLHPTEMHGAGKKLEGASGFVGEKKMSCLLCWRLQEAQSKQLP